MGGKLIRLRISLVALALIKEKAFNKIRSNKTKLRHGFTTKMKLRGGLGSKNVRLVPQLQKKTKPIGDIIRQLKVQDTTNPFKARTLRSN